MTFEEYAQYALETAVYPEAQGLEYVTMGLCSEAGEFAGKIKKLIRGDLNFDAQAAASELGDVLWYVAQCAHELSIPLNDVVMGNVIKLHQRQQKGTLLGDGDDR